MRAHQIMTRSVISITPNATILEAANTTLRYHVSGLPVVDAVGKLVGIVSEGDFIRRSEIGTQRKRGRWLSDQGVPVFSSARQIVLHNRQRLADMDT